MAAALPPTKLEIAQALSVVVGDLISDIPEGLEAKIPTTEEEVKADIAKCQVWAPELNRTITEMAAAGYALIEAARRLSDNRNNIPCRGQLLELLRVKGKTAFLDRGAVKKLVDSFGI